MSWAGAIQQVAAVAFVSLLPAAGVVTIVAVVASAIAGVIRHSVRL